jgi:serine kinase of HPr protein (carbohydrate metabolism regulator)
LDNFLNHEVSNVGNFNLAHIGNLVFFAFLHNYGISIYVELYELSIV